MSTIDKLRAIYDGLPRLACQRKCQASCGPVMWSRVEQEHIGKVLHGQFREGDLRTLVCPYLSAIGDCDIYTHRPLICRLWGIVERMRCPWGCVPERWVTDAEARELFARVGKL